MTGDEACENNLQMGRPDPHRRERHTMKLLEALLRDLPEGRIIDVRIGLRWTAVVVEVGGELRCGLCSTQAQLEAVHGSPTIPHAGGLEALPAREIAGWVWKKDQPTLVSLGLATLNALLPDPPASLTFEGNADRLLQEQGAGRRVALIGHFPFVPHLREAVGELMVLELHPGEGDLPADRAPEILPTCDVIAITGMALANHTLEDLLALCPPSAQVMILGPSTPLSPLLFDYGVRWLAGSRVEDIESVLKAVSQGGNFRQVHQAGVRLITLDRDRWQADNGILRPSG